MAAEQKTQQVNEQSSAVRVGFRIFSDAITICCAVTVGQLIFTIGQSGSGRLNHTAVSVVLAAIWIALVTMGRGVPQVTARGTTEYLTLVAATLQVFGVIAIGSLLLHAEFAFGYLTFAFLVGLGALVGTRWMWRHAAVGTAPAWMTATPRNPL